MSAFRQLLSVKGRRGLDLTVTVIVYRGTAWVTIGPPFAPEAILRPAGREPR